MIIIGIIFRTAFIIVLKHYEQCFLRCYVDDNLYIGEIVTYRMCIALMTTLYEGVPGPKYITASIQLSLYNSKTVLY